MIGRVMEIIDFLFRHVETYTCCIRFIVIKEIYKEAVALLVAESRRAELTVRQGCTEADLSFSRHGKSHKWDLIGQTTVNGLGNLGAEFHAGYNVSARGSAMSSKGRAEVIFTLYVLPFSSLKVLETSTSGSTSGESNSVRPT